MSTIFQRLLFYFVIGFVVLNLSSCSKESEEHLGAIEGQVQPTNATQTVTITPAKGSVITLVPDATSGQFNFPSLAPGVYSLCAVPATGYNVPDTIKVTVTAGSTVSATLNFRRDGRIRGTMSWEQDGKVYQAGDRFYGQIQSSFFSLEGNTIIESGYSHSLALVLPQLVRGQATAFKGVGVYPLGVEEFPFAKYTYNIHNAGYITAFDQYVTLQYNPPVGEVRITRFDLTARVASGTFEFTAWPDLANTGMVKPMTRITNGKFDITF